MFEKEGNNILICGINLEQFEWTDFFLNFWLE